MHAISSQVRMVIELDQLLNEIGQRDIGSIKIRRLDLMIAQKQQDIDGYKEFRMKLYEALNDDLIDRDEYDKMRSKYTQMIDEAQLAVSRLNAQRAELQASTGTNRGWVEQFAKFSDLQELTREAVVTLIDRIYVYEDKRIKIDFNYRNEIAYYQEILEQAAKEVV